jgi:hypothetical protein
MSISSLNWLAVVVAAIVAFVVGGVWYGPLFGKVWQVANGFTKEQLETRRIGLVFGMALLCSLVASFVLAMFIGPEAGAGFGALAGALAGVGWVAMFTGIQYLFEMRSLLLFLINAGYSIVTLTAMGAILGAW